MERTDTTPSPGAMRAARKVASELCIVPDSDPSATGSAERVAHIIDRETGAAALAALLASITLPDTGSIRDKRKAYDVLYAWAVATVRAADAALARWEGR